MIQYQYIVYSIILAFLLLACQSEQHQLKELTISEIFEYDYESPFQAEHELFSKNHFYLISDLNSKVPSVFGEKSIFQEFEFNKDSTISTKASVSIENTRIPSIIDSLERIGAKESNSFQDGTEISSGENAFYSRSYRVQLDLKNSLNLHVLGKENASTITFFKDKERLESFEIPDASSYSLRFIDLNNDGKKELMLYSAQMNSYMNVKVFQVCN